MILTPLKTIFRAEGTFWDMGRFMTGNVSWGDVSRCVCEPFTTVKWNRFQVWVWHVNKTVLFFVPKKGFLACSPQPGGLFWKANKISIFSALFHLVFANYLSKFLLQHVLPCLVRSCETRSSLRFSIWAMR